MSPSNSLISWYKTTALFLAVSMTSSTLSLFAAPAFSQTRFNDVEGTWAQACISELAQQKVISGYPDGSFRPGASVTRAEFAAMLGKAFPTAAPVRGPVQFSDVPNTSWAYQPIQNAARTGFLTGYPGNTFNPGQNIPRVQVLVSLVSGLNYTPQGAVNAILANNFADATEIPGYARSGIAAATQKRLVVNYPDVRLLNPNLLASRADVAAFLCQAINPGATALVPSQYVAGIPNQAGQSNAALPAGTIIPVRYDEGQRIIIAAQETASLTLTVAEDVTNAGGAVVITRGSQIVGELQPRQGGSQFVAQELIIGDRRVPLQASSAVITRTREANDPNLLSLARNSVLGAAAAAGISGLVGNRTITAQKVLPGAALGAAIETNQGRPATSIIRDTLLGAAAAAGVSGVVGDKTITAEKVLSGAGFGAAIGGVVDPAVKRVVIIEPDTDLNLTLSSRLALR